VLCCGQGHATIDRKGGVVLGMCPPSIRTPSHSIDLDNVRSNLSKGAGGALSPVALLSPSGRRGAARGSAAFLPDDEKLRRLLQNGDGNGEDDGDGFLRGPSNTEQILQALERTRDWAARVPQQTAAAVAGGNADPQEAAGPALAGSQMGAAAGAPSPGAQVC
jgi:hypothetical protein